MIMGGSERNVDILRWKCTMGIIGHLESYQYLVFERSYHFQSNMLSSNFDGLKVLLT